jgi:transcriptional regulator with XRE-family HTH domain
MMSEMTAGAILRTARSRHGLTQRQLAARARTSQAAISRVERDLVSPTVATLAHWLELMGEELRLDIVPIDFGVDPTLFDETLALTPQQRIERLASWSRGMEKIRRARRD